MFLFLFFVILMGWKGYKELRDTRSSGVPDNKEVEDIERYRSIIWLEVHGLEGTIIFGVCGFKSRRHPLGSLEGAPLFGWCPKIVSLTEIYQSSSSFSLARERTVARTEFIIFRPGPARIFSPILNYIE